MSSDPSVDASGVHLPAEPWPSDAQPVDPNAWTPPPPGWAGSPPPGRAEPAAHGWSAPPPPSPAVAAPPRRWRVAPRSLTGRLVVGVVSLVVVLVLATGAGTYYALRSFLIDRLDQQVQTTASGSIKDLFSGHGPPAAGSGVRAPQFVWAVAIDAQGTVLAQPASSTVESLNLTSDDRHRLTTAGSKPITVRTTDGIDLRVTTRPAQVISLPSGNAVPAIAVIGLSTDEVERTLHRLLELELVIGASAVILALFATAYGVRFSLRRLYGVTRTAREVAAELSPEGAGLDRRVAVTDPDTEVGQLAESMNTLLAAVEMQFAARLANEQRMRQFLADASHELRTPLTSIRGYAELARIQRRQGGAGSETAADNLARIESEGTRMSRLVDDLLTLARSDQGGLPEHDWVDVAELLDEAAAGARAAYPARRIEVSAPQLLTLIGDRDQLLRVVRNLVTNAAVHTRVDGAITVTGAYEADSVVVRVVDAGPGLPPEEAAHVFERFWRADQARSRARGGSGLGLAIVASIVQSHGGTVQFDSSVEGGSTVTVRLPTGTG